MNTRQIIIRYPVAPGGASGLYAACQGSIRLRAKPGQVIV